MNASVLERWRKPRVEELAMTEERAAALIGAARYVSVLAILGNSHAHKLYHHVRVTKAEAKRAITSGYSDHRRHPTIYGQPVVVAELDGFSCFIGGGP